MPSNEQWLSYWKDCLNYANIKPIDINNEPIRAENSHFLERIPKKAVKDLKTQTKVRRGDKKINIAICPVQSAIHIESQKQKKEAHCLFWIPACVNEEGYISVQLIFNKPVLPFFVRDFLGPNPSDYVRISDTKTIDKKLSEYHFNSNDWQDHWKLCETVFQAVTGKTFAEFNNLKQPEIYIETFSSTDFSQNITNLYDKLQDKDSPINELPLLSNIIQQTETTKSAPPEHETVLANTQHIGQFSGEYPLSRSQRVSMCALTQSGSNEILAVNGPPGTGKTTLLQSVIANLVVESVVNDDEPHLILASSTNNQAITNILAGFSLPDDKDLLTDRWLPTIDSLGLYMTKPKNDGYLYYDLAMRNRTAGFFADYENRPVDQTMEEYLSKFNQYFNEHISSLASAKSYLKQRIIECKKNIERSINIAHSANTAKFLLDQERFQNPEHLFQQATEQQTRASQLKNQIKNAQDIKQKLSQTQQGQSLTSKILNAFGLFKKKEETKYRTIVQPLEKEIEVSDWSNYQHIDKRIEKFLLKLQQRREQCLSNSKQLNTDCELVKQWNQSIKKWTDLIALWDQQFGDKLQKLYRATGAEYRDLSYSEDINVRLDISYRFEAFWLALHYREADYLERLACRQDAGETGAEFGEKTYKEKLRRYACLTPIFISTFHSAPKYSRYFDGEEQAYYELFDYLIVDEAGQVSPVVAVPTFSLAKKALVVGDVLQIEPVYPITEAIDFATFKHHLNKGETIAEEQLKVWKESGKLGGSGSLMQMAQFASRYKQADGRQHGLLLTEHRRCLDQLISYCNHYVYNGQLEPKRGRVPAKKLDFIEGMKGYVHIDYPSERSGSSRVNLREASCIAKWLEINHKAFIEAYRKPIEQIVAIVTPYKPQASKIKSALKVNKDFSKITVGTTHALQGAERPIVLFSLVVSPNDSLGFVNTKNNMLNVTISRAKDYFVMFGNMNTLATTSNSPLGNLRKWLLTNPSAELDNSFIFDSIGDLKSPRNQKFYRGQFSKHIATTSEHDKTLRTAIETCDKELIIVSPFLSIRVLTNTLQKTLETAIKKGAKITVYCDKKLDINKTNQTRKQHSADAIKLLLKLGVTVREIDGIHSKTLIFSVKNEPVLVEGSFNWLSAVRDETSEYHRHEASISLKGKELKPYCKELKETLEKRSNQTLFEKSTS